MEKRPAILAIGANPAWQKVLQFENLQHNAVNRAAQLWNFASGKGINFARAAHNWQRADVKLLQFAGGDNGKLLLDDLAKETLDVKTVAVEMPTRCCITCLSRADNSMTELIEPSQAPGAAAENAALEFVQQYMKSADGLALCGQLPGGMSPDFYVKSVEYACSNGRKILIDSWKNISGVLEIARNATLKINADELAALTGINDVRSALKSLFNSSRLEYIAITDGAKTAYFADCAGNVWQYNVPHIEQLVNPVGSGDTASAVFFSSMLAGEAPEKAFAYALAAASANCLSMKCAEFQLETALELFNDIKIALFPTRAGQ